MKLKIALLGYGKMGREVEKIALEHEHSIGVVIDNENDWTEKAGLLKACDVAIEFSMPAIVIQNIQRCFGAGIPIVVGTTGWYDQFPQISKLCVSGNKTLFYATNFSIGVNVFFEINRRLASILEAYPMYSPSMLEIHHTQKLDAPSGTAITLANEIIQANPRYTKITDADPKPGEIPVRSIREGNVPGTHTMTWSSDIDQITITHEAKNRRGLALGAVMAAAWVYNRKGVFTMKDILNF
jgi:4-hydroxy-tetrahydrodipicolinate reductase